MKYAVVISGGKQHRVVEGETLKVEKIPAEVGDSIHLDQVLMVANGDEIKLGKPLLSDSKVSATIVSHGRHKKISIVKFRRRKHHQKATGHRQHYTEIKIDNIMA